MTAPENWPALMRQAQEGDKAAYNRLLKGITPWVRSVLYRKMSFNQSFIEDILQEALIGIHVARHTYDASKPFKPWVLSIVHHKYVDAIRKLSRNKECFVDEDVTSAIAATNHEIRHIEHRSILDKALSVLKPAHRQTVLLAKIQGLSMEEVARETGQSVSSVKVTIHRAQKKMHAFLQEDHDADPAIAHCKH